MLLVLAFTSQITHTDPTKLALHAFYESTLGAQWANNIGWLQGSPCNGSTVRWWGLGCNASGHVIQLAADENNVQGTLPDELAALASPDFTQLWFTNNLLSGTLPSFLGNFGGMTDLVLENNAFSGTLPTQLGLMTQLESITLDGNAISGTVPTELGLLGATLGYLGLDSNALSGTIATELGQLSNLNWLNLDTNYAISGTIASQLGALSSLTWLDLYKNKISGTVPASLGELPLSTDLRLHANLLSGTLPASLGGLRPNYCYLTDVQCIADGAGAQICAGQPTNHFACPLPASLNASSACGGRGLNCSRAA